ncbi:MAG: glycosyltransferase family 2 protein [Candidatus Komeilibacteria bacterium]|nr:glycosyltransferase family 2 protein [Candidatus Komeilibacteria bacterium]
MDLSVIIVSWRVKELLFECLKSLYQHANGLDFEVIVIDNDSGDGTVEMIQENFPQVKIIASQINLGFAKANNLGLRQASGRYLLFLNPDTKFLDNALLNCVRKMENDGQIGVLGCKLLNHDLSLQPSVRRFPSVADHLLMIFKLHHLLPLKNYFALDFNYQHSQQIDQVMGAFFMVNRSALVKTGNWDEGYYLLFEEVDLCRRMINQGFKVYYYAEAAVVHYGGQSFKREAFNLKKQWIFSQSRLRYVKKHQGLYAYLLILLLTPISLLFSVFAPKNVR